MQVRTPVALSRSLSGKYLRERYEPPYPPSYVLNSTTNCSPRRMALALNNLKRVDMPLNKETKPTQPSEKETALGNDIGRINRDHPELEAFNGNISHNQRSSGCRMLKRPQSRPPATDSPLPTASLGAGAEFRW